MRALALLALPACYSVPPFVGGTGDGGSGIDARPSMHDEDNDGLFDGVDPCPHLKATQIDADGDGTGNDCDLDPNSPGETRLFYAFDAAPTDLQTSGFAAQMLIDTYDLGSVGAADGYLAPATMFGSARIDIAFEVIQSAANNMAELGLNFAAADFRNDGYGCFLTFDPAGFVLTARTNQGIALDTRIVSIPLAGLAGTLSAVRLVGGTMVCTLVPAGMTPLTVMLSTGSERGFASVKAADMQLRLSYLYIIARP